MLVVELDYLHNLEDLFQLPLDPIPGEGCGGAYPHTVGARGRL